MNATYGRRKYETTCNLPEVIYDDAHYMPYIYSYPLYASNSVHSFIETSEIDVSEIDVSEMDVYFAKTFSSLYILTRLLK